MEGYEKFKKDVYNLTTIDLNAYKEKQMRRRIDTLITKNSKTSYDDYVRPLMYQSFTGTRNNGQF